jgi:hypothetical protein
MPLTLTDTASGKSVKPITRPTPAYERTEDGGKALVAVLAPVPPTWVLFPITIGFSLRNDEPVSTATGLEAGDALVLGQKSFAVAACTAEVAADAPDAAPAAATCTVTVRFRNAEIACSTAIKSALMGTDPSCEIVLPADTGLAGHHAFLAVVEHRWHLFALTEAGFTRFGSDAPTLAAPLVRGESVWLGDVELTLDYDELDPLDFGYQDEAADSGGDPLDVYGFGAEETDQPAAAQHPTPAPSRSQWTTTSVHAARDNQFQVRALALCAWLQDEHVKAKPLARPTPVRGRALDAQPSGSDGDVDDLERFATRLKPNTWDPNALFDVAAYLWAVNLADNARWVLKELYRQNPNDPVVAESLAVVARSQAADAGRSNDSRLADIKRAFKYASVAAKLRPQDIHLLELVRAIGSEQTLLEMSQGGPSVRRRDDRP